MKTLQEIQKEIGEWAQQQFAMNTAKSESHHEGSVLHEIPSFYGMISELGELAALDVREMQGRSKLKTADERQEARADALADCMVFMCDYAHRMGIDLNTVLDKTWQKVSQRRQKTWEEDKAKEAAELTVGGLEHEERVLADQARMTEAFLNRTGCATHGAGCEEGSHCWQHSGLEATARVALFRCKHCGAETKRRLD